MTSKRWCLGGEGEALEGWVTLKNEYWIKILKEFILWGGSETKYRTQNERNAIKMSQIIGTSGKITRGKSECTKNWPFSMKLLITVFRQLVIKFVTEVISWPVHLQHHPPLSSAICMLESLPSFLTWPFGIFWLKWRWVPHFQISWFESMKMKKTETPYLGYFSCEYGIFSYSDNLIQWI